MLSCPMSEREILFLSEKPGRLATRVTRSTIEVVNSYHYGFAHVPNIDL